LKTFIKIGYIRAPNDISFMGVDLSPIINVKRRISLEELANKRVSIDCYNMLYQFLTIVRSPDGTPLMDNQGRITSHISGIFYRTVNMLERGIEPVYVLDGKSPELKAREIANRINFKTKAKASYEKAKQANDVQSMRKYSIQAASLQNYMIDDTKKLLTLMGVPWVQAPSEGEAQAAQMAQRGVCWGSVSQDYDSLLFGSPRLIRNLAISGRRKVPNRDFYIEVSPELIQLEDLLKDLNISRAQLIDLCILMGTDFNRGITGIGPKKALKLIKDNGRIEAIKGIDLRLVDVDGIRSIFFDMPTLKEEKELSLQDPNREGLLEFLCYERNFSRERVETALGRINRRKAPAGDSLDRWLQ